MTLEEIKQYLKDNLSIDSTTERGYYGESGYVKVAIYLEGEKISEAYIDIPDPK